MLFRSDGSKTWRAGDPLTGDILTLTPLFGPDGVVLEQRGPYFDYASACLQIAIVLASVAIISGGSVLLAASALLGLAGAMFTAHAYTLAMPLMG